MLGVSKRFNHNFITMLSFANQIWQWTDDEKLIGLWWFPKIGLPLVIIHFNVPYKPFHYWGIPMTMETPRSKSLYSDVPDRGLHPDNELVGGFLPPLWKKIRQLGWWNSQDIPYAHHGAGLFTYIKNPIKSPSYL